MNSRINQNIKEKKGRNLEEASYKTLKHSQNICNVCGGHLISMNFPPGNWEGYYANSSKVGRKLCLIIGVRIVPPLKGRHKNPPIYRPCDLHRFGS